MRLDRHQHEIDRADLAGGRRGPHRRDGDVSERQRLDPEAAGAQRLELGAPRDHPHVLATPDEQARVERAHAACPEDRDPHRRRRAGAGRYVIVALLITATGRPGVLK